MIHLTQTRLALVEAGVYMNNFVQIYLAIISEHSFKNPTQLRIHYIDSAHLKGPRIIIPATIRTCVRLLYPRLFYTSSCHNTKSALPRRIQS